MDIFAEKKRSEIMSKIRSKNTRAEKIVFRRLKKKRVYFQKHYSRVAGSLDIALPRKKKAVFIDGDFWHGWQFSRIKNKLPKKYWQAKIEGNIRRDKKVRLKLKKSGWKVLRIWEHEIYNNLDIATSKIESFLNN